MSTPGMVWGCLWRATLLLLASGAVLGGLYGALTGATFLLPVFAQDYPDQVMSETEEFQAAAGLLLFASFIGGGIGVAMGAAMGLAAGLLLGALLAALTRCFFFYDPDPVAHRRAAGRAGVVAPVPLVAALWALYGSSLAAVVGVVVVPVLVLSLAGWFVGRRVAGWWSGESARPGQRGARATPTVAGSGPLVVPASLIAPPRHRHCVLVCPDGLLASFRCEIDNLCT